MIVFDFSNVYHANLNQAKNIAYRQKEDLSFELLRHMLLNSIRATLMKVRTHPGEPVVIAGDGGLNWRKSKYPFYKAGRRESRESDAEYWEQVFAFNKEILQDLRDYFPYIVIHEQIAEADDVIAVLCRAIPSVTIVSRDKDFQQLQAYEGVKQYDPIKKIFIECSDPAQFRLEHILQGDGSDGIPNFLSSDNCLITEGEKQIALRKTMREKWMANAHDAGWVSIQPKTEKDGFYRNMDLIDLMNIGHDISEAVLESYNDQTAKAGDKKRVREYFMKHNLRQLTEKVMDF